MTHATNLLNTHIDTALHNALAFHREQRTDDRDVKIGEVIELIDAVEILESDEEAFGAWMPTLEEVSPKQDYRELELYEVMQEGDEVLVKNETPKPINNDQIGKKYLNHNVGVRRPITPEPKQEYRMLSVGETLQADDEFDYPYKGWQKSHEAGNKVYASGRYRRPVTPDTEVIPEIVGEARKAGCNTDMMVIGYLAAEVSRLRSVVKSES